MSHPSRFWLRLKPNLGAGGAVLCPWVNESSRASLNILKMPSGVPHQLTVDDHYRGYFLPRDSTVLANVWCVVLRLRADPRFIDPQGNHPE